MKITILADEYEDGSHDPAVDQVEAALTEGKHRVSRLLVRTDIKAIIAGLSGRRRPDLVFHLINDFGGESGLIATAAIVDALGIPYTGGGPGELFLRGNKTLAKKVLAYEHLKTPDFAVFSKDASFETGGNLRMPLIVKPLERDGSVGIKSDALVRTVPEMMERVLAIHRDVGDSALAEEYIEGREFYVGVLGNRERTPFPPVEMDFSGLPEGAPRVLGYEAKWEEDSPEYRGTKAVLPDLAPEFQARLQQAAVTACRSLLVRDYARVDMRVSETNDVYIIEVNANCDLASASEFATGAKAAGIDYVPLINRIAELAMERRRPATDPAPTPAKPPARRKTKAKG